MEIFKTNHILTTYYAPRGNNRMYILGQKIAQQYLSPTDRLIGLIGDAGSGKSALIRGMFPGLELTNDDNGVNVRPLPILNQDRGFAFFSPHTYHLDIRFENGFTQMPDLADAIREALNNNKRVVVEHFDLIYPLLGANANLLIGVGEEIIITRPTIFGPVPQEVYQRAYDSLPYRLMAHTAEDLCERFMPREELERCSHGDVHHGFILAFPERRPAIDLNQLEQQVQDAIARDLPIDYVDESHIRIGGLLHGCTGPRTHVRSTGQVQGFRLLKHFIFDPYARSYLLVGCVGEDSDSYLQRLDKVCV